MALQLGFDLIKETFTQTTIFGVNWIITLAVTIIALALINGKNWNDYKTTLLPMTIALHIVGLTPSILQYVIGSIMLVMDTLSLEMLGSIAETTTNIAKRTTENIGMIKEKIFDREQFKAVKEKEQEYRKKAKTDKLEKLFKKRTTTGFDKEGKPKSIEVIDETALQQARQAGLGKTIRQSQEVSQTRLDRLRQELLQKSLATELGQTTPPRTYKEELERLRRQKEILNKRKAKLVKTKRFTR